MTNLLGEQQLGQLGEQRLGLRGERRRATRETTIRQLLPLVVRVYLWNWDGVGLWDSLDDGCWDGHKVVHLAAVLSLGDGCVQSLGVRLQNSRGLVVHGTVRVRSQTVTVTMAIVGDGARNGDKSGQDLGAANRIE